MTPARKERSPGSPSSGVTSTGASLIAGVVVVWVAGAALGYPALVVLAGGGALTVLAAAAFVCWRPSVKVGREFAPATVTAGDSAAAILELTNLARLPSPPVTVLDQVGDRRVALPVRALGANRSALVRYSLPTMRRGRVALGPLRVVRSDPLGIFRRLQVHGGADVLWVHAPVHPMAPLPSGVVMDFEGPITDTAAQGSLTFSTLREYVAGDDRRQIHWRSSAKLGTLVVRQHVDTNEPQVTVVLDARANAWPNDTFEEGVSVAASVARTVRSIGHPLALSIVGEDRAAARALGAVTVDDRLAATTTIDQPGVQPLLATLEAAASGGALVVVTGRVEAGLEARVSAQGRRFAPVVVCSIIEGERARWRRRSGIRVLSGPDVVAVATAWNTMVRA